MVIDETKQKASDHRREMSLDAEPYGRTGDHLPPKWWNVNWSENNTKKQKQQIPKAERDGYQDVGHT